MTIEQAKGLPLGQQVWFCVFALNDDVSGVLFGTGACYNLNGDMLSISTGKGSLKAAVDHTFFTAEEMTAYLTRYFAIVNEKVKP